MTILRRLFKCLCVCICIEKGSWSPKTDKVTTNHKVVVQKNPKNEKFRKCSETYKPEWLKQWTISKGWMHDRTHMLTLGTNDNIAEKTNETNEIGSSSSVDNASDLLSIIDNIEEHATSSRIEMKTLEIHSSKKNLEDEFDRIEVDKSDVYSEVNVNYRNNFPVIKKPFVVESDVTKQSNYFTFSKYFKTKDKEIKYSKIVFPSRQTLFRNSDASKENLNNKPVTKYKTFDDLTALDNLEYENSGDKQKLPNKKEPKMLSRSVQQDTIYECSEDSFSLYTNPIYESRQEYQNDVQFLDGKRNMEELYDYNKNSSCEYQKFLNNDLNTNKLTTKNEFIRGSPLRSIKSRFSSDKYIIRHIRIRIMLTLRLKKFQRLYRKRLRNTRQIYAHAKGRRRTKEDKRKESANCDTAMRSEILKVHDEQRRIGNGKTSLKIQNLRYGRLNVLRWLLWETQTQEQRSDPGAMPALERDKPSGAMAGPGAGASSSTLALHYAAARGCLDCVRLLVDSTTELSANTQMDNDVTPVYLAAQEGHLEVLKFLVLEAGGSLYVRAKDGMAPLHAASQMGCLNCVKWMIQEQGVDPNLRDGDGATPLHFAASRGHLDTVRWLLRHGARLSLDKYGKSPINDAAENQQVECLNVLVQHGATPDYNDSDRSVSLKHGCSCTRKSDTQSRSSHGSECNNCAKNGSEPFYLHPPSLTSQRSNTSIEAPHAPQDGLYINPMNNHRHSASSSSGSCSGDSVNGESFFLHNPQEVIYNRVRDLFESSANQTNQQKHQPLSALTVKVEVHSSSSGAGSDENLSSSDLSERSGDHEHDYEDIYLAREESKASTKERSTGVRSRSRDSGSHSRSGSASSSNSGCNVIVKLTPNNTKDKPDIKRTNEFLPKPQKYEKPKKEDKNSPESGLSSSPSDLYSEEEHEKMKLQARHSLQPPKKENNKMLKRVVSVPVDICPPPPPPPPPAVLGDVKRELEAVEVVEEPTVKPSDVVKGMVRSMSTIGAAKRLNSSCSDLTIISLHDGDDADKPGPNLVNKQRVLPFIPPSFPGSGDSNSLIKPSEYLRSISDKRSSVSSSRCSDYDDPCVVIEEKKEEVKPPACPPPPPLPAPVKDQSQATLKLTDDNKETNKKQQQPLSAISIHDLNSVQLRRTDKMLASKTFSAPTRSMSLQCLQSDNYLAQKNDLISELKMSKDITGIKKMKVERAKVEEKYEKQMVTEITKQFTASNFVEKIPDKDNIGNVIPVWKRQMMAKKAAERARRELEEQILKEAEEKRLQAIPQWKRQLMAKKEETEIKIKATIYTPKVEDSRTVKAVDPEEIWRQEPSVTEKQPPVNGDCCNKENSKPEVVVEPPKDEEPRPQEEQNIIPWRAQLRKTNSKLNLLD